MTDKNTQAVEAAVQQLMQCIEKNCVILSGQQPLLERAIADLVIAGQPALTSQEVAAEVGDIDVESIRQYLASGLDLGHAVTLGHISEACVHRALVAASRSPAPAGVAGGVDAVTLESEVRAIAYMDQSNSAGRDTDAREMLVPATQAQPSPHPVAGSGKDALEAWHAEADRLKKCVDYATSGIEAMKFCTMLAAHLNTNPTPEQGRAVDVGAGE